MSFNYRMSISKSILFYFEQYINFEYLMFCIFWFRDRFYDLPDMSTAVKNSPLLMALYRIGHVRQDK